MGPDGVCGTSLESFVKAFEGILEGIADENGSRKKKFTSDDQKAISVIHKLISSSRTRKSSNNNRPPSSGVNIYELNESLLYEWEESAPPSVAVQQLVSLLSKPVVKSLLWTYEHIMDGRYSPRLPDIPYEVDDEEGIAIKMIRLVKGNEALGATIKCDTDGCVFVARIIAGGVADRCASIQV
ncbi:unnamed protein product [Anisakis simplex]|uniref:Maternal effect embryo arrest 14 n=1 Tax=Anisakis simplex TaxID=6269 RepID=A0A0M3KBX9_ANISI|nr:unnamed protein product [Anisakis simplex]